MARKTKKQLEAEAAEKMINLQVKKTEHELPAAVRKLNWKAKPGAGMVTIGSTS